MFVTSRAILCFVMMSSLAAGLVLTSQHSAAFSGRRSHSMAFRKPMTSLQICGESMNRPKLATVNELLRNPRRPIPLLRRTLARIRRNNDGC